MHVVSLPPLFKFPSYGLALSPPLFRWPGDEASYGTAGTRILLALGQASINFYLHMHAYSIIRRESIHVHVNVPTSCSPPLFLVANLFELPSEPYTE